jgi:hypothetical protein
MCTTSGDWECRELICPNGPNRGWCTPVCACLGEDDEEPEGDAWICDITTGLMQCFGQICSDGPNVGKCMYDCSE